MNKASYTRDLFLRYAGELQRFVSNKFGGVDEADDIVQDAFHNFLRAKCTESIDNPRAYLYQTAHNLALNRIRKQSYHENYLAEPRDEHEDRGPERVVLGQKNLDHLDKILSALPENCKRAFILRRVHEKPYKEISRELGVSVSSVEKYLVKAVDYLRGHIDEMR